MTFDIPDAFLKELKIRAVNEGKTFKDLVTELMRKGLDAMEKGYENNRRPSGWPRSRVKVKGPEAWPKN
jgi:hypothetical protein